MADTWREGIYLDTRDYLLIAAEAASDKKAEDIVALDVVELLVVTECFLICTGRNDRQVRTIAEEIELKVKKAGLSPMGVEGRDEARWVLIDFGDFVAHVFQPEEREFYRLETLWKEAPRIELLAIETDLPRAESVSSRAGVPVEHVRESAES
ncbi:MAG: ribosome silencing factor [Coriobacteriia bacterium]|nr:ribosome silencing factor [Coriobacteriia bacterium]